MGQFQSHTIQNKECVKKYYKFICTGEKKDLDDCKKYYDEYIDKMNKNYENNEEYGRCVMLTTKKENYYIFNYNNNNIIKKIKLLEDKLPTNYLNKFMELFDVRPRENCCNCISIVIYSNMMPFKLSMYLPNILVSLKNIQKHLPQWILRLYLDRSVFELIYEQEYNSDGSKKDCEKFNLGCEYRKILNEIFNHPNCEVYLSICDKIYKDGFKLSSLRSQRYHGFFDETVNINASREADGFISSFDCHNLKTLESSDCIFFMYPFNRQYSYRYFDINDDNLIVDINKYPVIYNFSEIYLKNNEKFDTEQINIFVDPEYAQWHLQYKTYKTLYNIYNNKIKHDKEYVPHYENYTILMPILAGLFASKCKLKSEVYYNTVLSIRKFIDVDFIDIFGVSSLNIDGTIIDYNKIHENLLIGYDEILLMVLMEPIFGANFSIEDNQVILHKAKHIFDLIGLSMSKSECIKLDYKYCVDISEKIFKTEICISDEDLKTKNISNYTFQTNSNDTLYITRLLCYDKINNYEEYKGNFIYPTKYFMDVLNYGNQHIKDENDLSDYNWFMSFYDIYKKDNKIKQKNISNDNIISKNKYFNKYKKYKKKYLQLKQLK